VAEPIRLALVWHMHQPSYRDAVSGEFLLPWARLHATKDYADMAALLGRYPRVHATFNLTPILLEQLEEIASGASDRWLTIARRPAESLSEEERAFVLTRFFDVHRERMLDTHPPYRALEREAREALARDSGRSASARLLRDLSVWFHLAWVDPGYRDEEPMRGLLRRGSGFNEAEKTALLDWGVALAGRVAGEYRALAAAGQVELTTSAYHHPILPLVLDTEAPREVSTSMFLPSPPFRAPEDAAVHVRRARDTHSKRFGSAPFGTWPPEGAVNDAALALLAAEGFRWAASDETVLAAALGARDGALREWPAALYRPYRVETKAGPIDMVFRDRRLSDLVGFTYGHWGAEDAAKDFVRHVRAAGAEAMKVRGVGPAGAPIVTVILDGENCWEHYAEDGHPFLNALYAEITAAPDILAVTVREALEQVPARERITHVPVGSWIRSDLAIWAGHPDKNRAWEELGRARAAVAAAGSRSAEAAAAATNAMEEIYAAEASDWFWWYGDDHPSAHRAEIDRLFRSRLITAYRAVGLEEPASLRSSLREDAAAARPAGWAAGRPTPWVWPQLDGDVTDFFEWRDAMSYDAGSGTGAMHRVDVRIRALRWGTDGSAFHLRVDWAEGAGLGDGETLEIAFEAEEGRTRVARVSTRGGLRGVTEWAAEAGLPPHAEEGGAATSGRYAIGRVVEISIPFERCGAAPGRPLHFRVTLSREGNPVDQVPVSGWLGLTIPTAAIDLVSWSAL
jgi:alpha-amylase/alpha-mannosidase (GH57 family)